MISSACVSTHFRTRNMHLSAPPRDFKPKRRDRASTDVDDIAIASNFSAKELPSRIYFNVPYERNRNFVGREECLEAIDKIFSGPKYTPFVALYGLGGIGSV